MECLFPFYAAIIHPSDQDKHIDIAHEFLQGIWESTTQYFTFYGTNKTSNRLKSLTVAAVKRESSMKSPIYNAYSKDLNNYIKYLQINLEDKKKWDK